MKMKTFKQELIEYHMKSDQEYCCYCIESKDDKWHCCQENHFIKFSDFDEDTQSEFIALELDEYEKMLDKQGALK